MSLAGSRGGAPLWGLGQRPNCSTSDQPQGSRQQRRRQRSVPASNFALPQERPPSRSFQHLCCVAPNGRDRVAVLSYCKWLFPKRRDFASAEATKGLSDRPLETFGAATFGVVRGLTLLLQGFRLCGDDQRAMKTDEVCDRPLETFGADTPMSLGLFRG